MVYRLLHIMALNTMILKQEENTNQVTLVKYKKEVKHLNKRKWKRWYEMLGSLSRTH